MKLLTENDEEQPPKHPPSSSGEIANYVFDPGTGFMQQRRLRSTRYHSKLRLLQVVKISYPEYNNFWQGARVEGADYVSNYVI